MYISASGRGHAWQSYSLGTDQLGSSFAEKALANLVSSKLSMS